MPYCPTSHWADADTSGSKPLHFPLYSTPPEANDLDHFLTILRRILTNMSKARPLCAAAEEAVSILLCPHLPRFWRCRRIKDGKPFCLPAPPLAGPDG